MRLEVNGGAAADVETANGNHDLVAHLRGEAIGRGDKGYAAWKLKYCLRAIEALRRTILDVQGVGELPTGADRMRSRKMDAHVPRKVGLGHDKLVKKGGSSGGGGRDGIAPQWIDARFKHGALSPPSRHLSPQPPHICPGCRT